MSYYILSINSSLPVYVQAVFSLFLRWKYGICILVNMIREINPISLYYNVAYFQTYS